MHKLLETGLWWQKSTPVGLFVFVLIGCGALQNAQSATLRIGGIEPTVGLPGFNAITIVADSPGQIRGLDLTFRGPMNQINPAGAETIFFVPFFGFTFPSLFSEDSRFSFIASDLLVVPGYSIESSDTLRAAFTFQEFPDPGVTLEVARLVVPQGQTVTVEGAIAVQLDPQRLMLPGSQAISVSAEFRSIPEPFSLVVLCLGLAVLGAQPLRARSV